VKWDGSTVDLGDVAWSSPDPTIINLEPLQGVVTIHGLKVGAVEVTASAAGRTASTTVTVTAAVPEKLSVTPAEAETRIGFPVQLTAIATLTDGRTRDVTQECAWSSSDDTIASAVTVPAQLGNIMGRKAGSVFATA